MLGSWAASPARFREDANAEEDYALGGYRDRLIVELAQNAADAAVRAGIPGELRLEFDGSTLRAANVGEPLSAEGVQALATLRASAKREGATVGRFGVGFAAVLAISDEPAIISRTGGVRFSRSATASAVAELPSLAGELARRGGHVPVLRLPWPVAGTPPDGYATEVVLPVRPDAVDVVRAALDDIDADLLLGLPALHRIRIGDRIVSADWDGDVVRLDDRTWRVRRAEGVIPPELLDDRPTEEALRDRWSITWAVPDDGPLPPGVLYAPTPSAEPVTVPARLIGTIPLDPDRRHVAPGPLTDHLISRAAVAYAELLTVLDDPLRFVPRPTLAGAEFDAALVNSVLEELRRTRFLSTVDGSPVAPAGAVVLDSVDPTPFAGVLSGLLPAVWAPPLQILGVRRISVAELIELLSTVDRPATWWRTAYDALSDADRDALAGLPVPLVDGRTVPGPRGVLLPDAELPALDALGLPVADPDAVHPLLERLGATRASPAGVLADPRVRTLVESSIDHESPLWEAILPLVAAAGTDVDELPWLAELALPGADGEWYPAGEMALPDSPLAAVIEPDAPFGIPDPHLVAEFGPESLLAVGVLATFAVLRVEDVDPTTADLQLDGESDWYAVLLDLAPDSDLPPTLPVVEAVRDLEFVRADAWPAALRQINVAPTTSCVLADGRRIEVPSYTRWWLSCHPVLDGRRPDRLRAAEAVELAGLYDPAGSEFAQLTGVRTGLDDVLADIAAIPDLLERLGDARRRVEPWVLADVYSQIATAAADFELEPPDFVRVAADRVVPRRVAAVLDVPYVLPLVDAPLVPAGGAPVAVADLLQLPLASTLVDPIDVAPEAPRPWASVPGVQLAAARCGGPVPATAVDIHSGQSELMWWPTDSVDHIWGGADALGRALAWRLGRWDRRAAAAEAFAHPDRADELAAEDVCE